MNVGTLGLFSVGVVNSTQTALLTSIPASQCGVSGGAFQVPGSQGITLGGGQITGLGGSGTAASAGDTSAVAIGNGATTSFGTLNAVAFGTGATASAANSVALGAGSVASRGAVSSYAAFGLSGPQTSIGDVSVGASGALRQITNLAAGQSATDAVNFGQLTGAASNLGGSLAAALGGGATYSTATGAVSAPVFAIGGSNYASVATALAAEDMRVTGNGTAITALQDGLSAGTLGFVQQNATSRLLTVGAATDGSRISMAGSAGTRLLSGLTDGSVVAGSTDAVTGNQLAATTFAVNTAVANAAATAASGLATLGGGLSATATALGGGAGYNTTTGLFTAPVFAIGSANYTSVATALAAEDLRVTGNGTAITALQDGLSAGTLGLVQQNPVSRLVTVGAATDGSRISIAGMTGTRVLTGLTDGSVAAGSTDAVTGNQLAATNLAVNSAAANAATAAATTATNAATAASGIATLGGGLAATATALGGGAGYNAATGVFTAPTFAIGGSNYASVATALAAEDMRVTGNGTAITALQDGLSAGTLGLVQQNPVSRLVTVGAATDGSRISIAGMTGTRVLTGLTDGSVAIGSTDAVTGNQLAATNLAVNTAATTVANAATNAATAASGIAAVGTSLASTVTALGGGAGYNATTGVFTAPIFAIGGANYTSVATALAAEDLRVTGNGTAITALQDGLSAGTLGLVQQNATSRLLTVGAGTDGTRMSVAGSAGTRLLAGLTDGSIAAGSTDAVTGNQLAATNLAVNTAVANAAAAAATTATNAATAASGIATVGGGLAATASALGGGAGYNITNGVFTAPIFAIGGTNYTSVATALAAEDLRVTGNGTAITALQDGFSAGTLGLVQQNVTSRLLTVGAATDGSRISMAGSAGTRLLTGLTDGSVVAGSTDAVTGNQLAATNLAVNSAAATVANAATNAATAASGIAAVGGSLAASATALGGGAGYNAATGVFTAPIFAIGGTNYTSVATALAAEDLRVTGNGTAITALQDGLSAGTLGLVQQNAATRLLTVGAATDGSRISMAGSTGTRLVTGLTDGSVLAGSTDAVTGNQLAATNLAVNSAVATVATNAATAASGIAAVGGGLAASATALGGGAGYNAATGVFTAPIFAIGGTNYTSVATALAAEDLRVTGNGTAITALQDGLSAGTLGLVQQNVTSRLLTVGAATDGSRISMAGSAGTRLLTGLTDGSVLAGSTDAVTGNQLAVVNLAVNTATANAATATTTAAIAAANAANAVGGLTTVGGGLSAAATALGGGAGYNAATGVFTAPIFAIGGSNYASVATALAAEDLRVTGNGTAITALQDGLSAGTLGLVQQNPVSRLLTVGAATDGSRISMAGSAGTRLLTGLTDGSVAAGSTDAITGNQLAATNLTANTAAANAATAAATTATNAATAASGIAAVGGGLSAAATALGGGAGYNTTTGLFTAPIFAIGGSNYASVATALAAEDLRVTGNGTAITALQDRVSAGTLGLVQQNAASRLLTVGAGTDGRRISVAGAAGDRQIGGVAAGASANDAVTVGQLNDALTTIGSGGSPAFASNNAAGLAPAAATGANGVAIGYGAVATASGSVAIGDGSVASDANTVSVGTPTAKRRITNLDDGDVSSGSTDAVTGSQLFATNQVLAATSAHVATLDGGLGGAVSALGGGASYNGATSVLTAPTYTIGGSTYATVGGALSAEDSRVDQAFTSLQMLQTAAGAGLVRQDGTTGVVTVASATAGTQIDVGGTVGSRRLSGLTDGLVASGSTQAVTGNQLYAVEQVLAVMTTNVANLQVGASTGSSSLDAKTLNNLRTGKEGPFRSNADGADYPVASGTRSTAGGYDAAATGTDTTAVGYAATASADGATALGSGAVASGDPTVAIGFQAAATGDEASAVGAYATASATNATALGRSAIATGTSSLAVGMSASASGAGAVAIGMGANAAHDNAVAIGTGVASSRANQVVIGSATQTYTLSGVASAASAAAQTGATGFVTTDVSGNLAASSVSPATVTALDSRVGALENDVKQLGQNIKHVSEGVAIALAMNGATLPGDKRYALSAGVGTFGGEAGFAASGLARLTENVVLTGGVGLATSGGSVAARAGVVFAW